MKGIRRLLIVIVVALFAVVPASAQFRFGVKLGIQTNSLHFDSSTFDSDNRSGFTGGVMTEFTVPVIGVGADVSLLYVHRNQRIIDTGDGESVHKGLDYIEVPVNLKWRINIPVINKIVRPFITSGPSFAFLTSGRAITDAVKNRKVDTAWNVGGGVELLTHLQVAASYGFGMSKAFEWTGATTDGRINGRTRCWTITAAYLF